MLLLDNIYHIYYIYIHTHLYLHQFASSSFRMIFIKHCISVMSSLWGLLSLLLSQSFCLFCFHMKASRPEMRHIASHADISLLVPIPLVFMMLLKKWVLKLLVSWFLPVFIQLYYTIQHLNPLTTSYTGKFLVLCPI